MLELTLEKKIFGGFSIALIILVIIAIFSYRSINNMAIDARWVSHTQEVLTRLESLLSNFNDAETGQRGYTITGKEEYLGPYYTALTNIKNGYENLKKLTLDNQKQQLRLLTLDTIISKRMKLNKMVIELRRTQGYSAAQLMVTSGKGNKIQDTLRLKIAEMVDEENQLMNIRGQESQNSIFMTKQIIILSSVLGISFLIGALFISSRGFKMQRRMEDIMIHKNNELQIATENAKSADKIKSSFLATMSHELRTPLNSIIGFTGIILKELAGPLNQEQKKQLNMVRESSRHLLSLINDVLDISKIEAGQLEVSSELFDLNESIFKVINIVKPLAESKNLSLLVQIAPELNKIETDKRRFEQILLNLLNNAIKFTNEGEIAMIAELVQDYKFKKEAGAQSAFRFSIKDTGIGIKQEDLATLFQPFRQIDSKLSRVHEGTGLGLAICGKLADLMGGEIHAESIWQKGSTFIFSVPFKN